MMPRRQTQIIVRAYSSHVRKESQISFQIVTKRWFCFLPFPNITILNIEHKPKVSHSHSHYHCIRPIDMELSELLEGDSR